ncbi:formate dehydrogenase accessory sulfurtransferase FdhD [Pseudoduganella sp. UC29_106]|uniref:formate dehydrogenase accessory sulfurtransferase FdhD n=1 Tax=Pseudoduganella sp. UC29_106 TaxID=3374553 RepID=UPI00375657A4
MDGDAKAASGYQERQITRHRGDALFVSSDCVAEELPVALVFNGISHVVMMATPLHLEELATGFALTEGIVDRPSQIYDVEVQQLPAATQVLLTIAEECFVRLKERRRTLTGRTGCGICGIESLALLDLTAAPIPAVPLPDPLGPAIARAARELGQHQDLMRMTGCVHAAAWCGMDGGVQYVFEDVGRHNALDKLVGHLAQQKAKQGSGFVFLSSRASSELTIKAARAGIPLLATISAPTSLAIDIARHSGLKLVCFCRADGFVDYSA